MCLNQWMTVAALACLALPQLPALAARLDTAVAQMVENTAADDPAKGTQAVEDLAAGGPKVVVQLVDALVEPGKGDDAKVRRALHGLAMHVSRPGAEKERAAFSEALCAALASGRPVAVKRFVITQIQLAGGAEAVAPLSVCLGNGPLAESARQALVAIGSPESIKAIREAIPKAEGLVRVGLIQALARPGDTESVPALMQEARSGEEAIRVAAVESLAVIGDAEAEPVVAAALGKGSPRAQRVVADAYVRLADAMAAKGQATIVFPQGRELKAKALEMYAKAYKVADDRGVRCAAVQSAAKAGGSGSLSLFLAAITDADGTVASVASRALAGIAEPQATVAIGEAMKNPDSAVRVALVRVLGMRKDADAAALLDAAAKDASAEVRVAAWDAQGRLSLPSMEMADTLAEAAEKGPPAIRGRAIAAYFELADARLRKGDEDSAVPMCQRLLRLPGDEPLHRATLSLIAEAGAEKSLRVIEPVLKDAALHDAAVLAQIAVAGRMREEPARQRAVEILRGIISGKPAKEILGPAVVALRGLGVDYDPAHDAGMVTKWWAIGPFPGHDVDKPWPPEEEVDVTRPVELEAGRQGKWKRYHGTDPEGALDLLELIGRHENATAYLYAEVVVDQSRDVVLKIGSNDGVKVWLNGKVIHQFGGSRALKIDEDSVAAHLQAGVNRLLLNVTQERGGWAASARIVDRDGKPVPFKQGREISRE